MNNHMNNNEEAPITSQDALEIELINGQTRRRGLEVEDDRGRPSDEDIRCTIAEVINLFEGLVEDTVLEDDITDIVSGMTTSFHYILQRTIRKQDDVQSEMAKLTREFDGSEVKDVQLQQQTNLMLQIDQQAEAFEAIRDLLADSMIVQYSAHWHPPRGSHVSEHRTLTASVVEARDFVRAIKNRRNDAHLPEGTRIGFSGGTGFNEIDKIYAMLDRALKRYPDMVLVHGGTKTGAEAIAKSWAEHHGISQIKCSPDWKTHNRAAPFRRNDEMLKLNLRALVACPGNGVTENLIDKARAKRVPVRIVE